MLGPTKLASLPELELEVQFVITCVQLAPNKMRTKTVTSEETATLLESSRVSVSSNVSAMSHSRHFYSECLSNVLK